MQERRTTRSEKPEEALSLFLEATRARLGLKGIAVGTSDGEMVAGAGVATGFLAGIGAKMISGKAMKKNIAIWSMVVGEKDYVIASMGSRLSEDLGAGVRRILAA